MRRPTPLPASPAGPAGSAKRGGAAGDSAAPGEEHAATPAPAPAVAPPVPLRRPAQAAPEERLTAVDAAAAGGAAATPIADAADPAASAVPAEGAATAGASDAAQGTTRIRDVWRAARARRRVLRAEVRRFTVRARRRRIGWIVAAASVATLVATTLVIAYGPFFAVEQIRIEGAVRLDAATLEEAVGAQRGRPLPLVDESEIKAVLVQFPMVESYQIEARPPHELLVRIVERTPIGVIEGPAGFSLVDAAGVVLETTPHAPVGAPLLHIAGGVDTPAFESAALVMRALPESVRHQVTGVTATTRDDVTLLLGGANASVVWGSVTDSALKALVLETAMTQMPPSGVVSYDVSSPGAIVIR